jgi:hypothetical protein
MFSLLMILIASSVTREHRRSHPSCGCGRKYADVKNTSLSDSPLELTGAQDASINPEELT